MTSVYFPGSLEPRLREAEEEENDYHIYSEIYEEPEEAHQQETELQSNKNNFQRQNPILELIQTEESYVNDLKIVINAFEKPLRKARILSDQDLNTIFLNWKSLLEYNQSFLHSLKERQRYYREQGETCIEMIGDVLCDYLPGMVEIYIGFCSKQLKAAKLLQKKTETDLNFREFAKKLSSTKRTNGLPLGAYLLKPMQRITRYPLLVDKILSKTSFGHVDQESCEKAYVLAQSLCDQVNEACRNQENEERLDWIQTNIKLTGLDSKITFNSLTKFLGPRKLIFSGYLIKVNSNKEVVAFLFNDFLLLTVPIHPIGKFNNLWACDKAMASSFSLYKKPILLNDLDVIDNTASISSSSNSSGFETGSDSKTSTTSSRGSYRNSLVSPQLSPTTMITLDQSNFVIRIKSMDKIIEFKATSSSDCNNWVRLMNQARRDYTNTLENRRNSVNLNAKCKLTQLNVPFK